MEMAGNRLWKWQATALYNLLSYPKQYATAYRNDRQPLMEAVCERLSSYLPC
jgi:cytochrome P450